MAYNLKLKEPLRDGIRRIAVEQLEKPLLPIAGPPERAIWVHETRKALKRTRALLRLVRSRLDPDVWKSENEALRDIARSLSPMRDRDILRQSMAALASEGDAKLQRAIDRCEAWIAKPHDQAMSSEAVAEQLAEARAAIAAARDRLAHLSLDGDMSDVLAEGLADGQRRGAKALARVEAEPTPENLHELRKASQTSWRHMVLVQEAWPDVTAARAAAAREVAQVLGEVQDYAVLAAAVESPPGASVARRRDAELIRTACEAGQLARQTIVIPSAARLFAGEPKSTGREFAACWEASKLMAAEASRRRKAARVPEVQAIRHPRGGRRTG